MENGRLQWLNAEVEFSERVRPASRIKRRTLVRKRKPSKSMKTKQELKAKVKTIVNEG